MINWQPIETAPKDGTRILLYLFNPYNNSREFQIGKWNEDKYVKKPKPYWSTDREALWGKRVTQQATVTHWSPLIPPEIEEIPDYELETIDNDNLPGMWHTSEVTYELRQQALESLAASYAMQPEEIELILEWFGSPSMNYALRSYEKKTWSSSDKKFPIEKLLEISYKMEFDWELV